MKKRLFPTSLFMSGWLLFVMFYGCSKENEDPVTKLSDYSDKNNWLEVAASATHPVDLIYLNPTTYVGDEMFCVVTDEGMRAGAKVVRQMQTSVFDGLTNVYMPYYRQVNAAKCLALSLDEQEKLIRSHPLNDCIAAFEYYLAHCNNGRPFILAGHSQGSNVLTFLLEYMKDKPQLLTRMVAAYVIGYSITTDFLSENPHLKFAERRDDTGVVISWNTESPGVKEKNPVVAMPEKAVVINPITWKRDETHADASLSLGSRMSITGGYEDKPHFADAQIDKKRGVVLCATIDPNQYHSSPIFPVGVLHSLDYSLYYYDMKQNIKERIEAYGKR